MTWWWLVPISLLLGAFLSVLKDAQRREIDTQRAFEEWRRKRVPRDTDVQR
jgi:hypothetical protein